MTVTCSVVLSLNVSTGLGKIMAVGVLGHLSQIRAQESPFTDLALMLMTWVGERS